jgi:dTDP-4-dehydrorhamnose 3,5-epimerase
MMVLPLEIPDVLLLKPLVYRDPRGHFLESWQDNRYAALGLPSRFVQDNVSVSRRGVLRGLHFQHPGGQGKLVMALTGSVFDVAVDVRRGSPTFGRWVGSELSGANGHQMWIPPGFAHGFEVLSDEAAFGYKCTVHYAPEHERSVRWDDPAVGIIWPESPIHMSEKDAAAPLLSACPDEALPIFGGVGRG